jgi:hypothetical protein
MIESCGGQHIPGQRARLTVRADRAGVRHANIKTDLPTTQPSPPAPPIGWDMAA